MAWYNDEFWTKKEKQKEEPKKEEPKKEEPKKEEPKKEEPKQIANNTSISEGKLKGDLEDRIDNSEIYKISVGKPRKDDKIVLETRRRNLREYAKKWRDKHKEKSKGYNKKYREKRKEKQKENETKENKEVS